MKYYNFVVKFYMKAIALLSFIAFVVRTQGFVMGWGKASEQYEKYPMLKTIEIVMAAVALVTLVIAVMAGRYLEDYKKKGISLAIAALILYGIYDISYDALTGLAVHKNLISIPGLVALTGSMVIVVMTAVYFHKRKELFT